MHMCAYLHLCIWVIASLGTWSDLGLSVCENHLFFRTSAQLEEDIAKTFSVWTPCSEKWRDGESLD